MTALSWHFQSMFEEGQFKVLNDYEIYAKTIRLFALDSYV